MMAENLRDVINGAMLPQFNGKNVSVTGNVTNKSPNGLSFDMVTTDNFNVKVNLRKPQRDNLEGYVEVHGIAQGKTINCDMLVQFPVEESKDFDVSAHNNLCQYLHTVTDLWKTSAS